MLTVGEWFGILRNTKNMVFGLQMEYGLPCNRYLIAQEFEKYYKDWFGEKCIRVYPTSKTLGGVMYCVFVYKNTHK